MMHGTAERIITVREYLENVTEKGIGKIWLDMDFLFFERCLTGLTGRTRKLFSEIRTGLDLLHKAAQMYDDASDLESDLGRKILNCVVFYALEEGYMRNLQDDASQTARKLRKLEADKAIVSLGDYLFERSVSHLRKAEEFSDGLVDTKALIDSALVIRAFAVRKWILRGRFEDGLSFTLRGITKFFLPIFTFA